MILAFSWKLPLENAKIVSDYPGNWAYRRFNLPAFSTSSDRFTLRMPSAERGAKVESIAPSD